MRKVLGSVLTVVGSFLVVLAVLAQFYVPARLMKTPLDVNSTTRLSGQATLYAAGKGDTFPVKAVSITRADSAKSDGNVVAFANSTCLVKDAGNVPDCVSSDDPQHRLVSASTDSFATNRSTATVFPPSPTSTCLLSGWWLSTSPTPSSDCSSATRSRKRRG